MEQRSRQPTNVQNRNTNSNTTLLPLPKSLQQPWEEYTSDRGSRKAAKDFSRYKRGQNKYKYCHPKVVWDLIAAHVRGAKLATHTYYWSYLHNLRLQLICTQIINAIWGSEKTTGHWIHSLWFNKCSSSGWCNINVRPECFNSFVQLYERAAVSGEFFTR